MPVGKAFDDVNDVTGHEVNRQTKVGKHAHTHIYINYGYLLQLYYKLYVLKEIQMLTSMKQFL